MTVKDRFLSGPEVDNRYGISAMTRWRWQRNPSLKFPKPIEINRRKLWRLSDLEEWERSRAACTVLHPQLKACEQDDSGLVFMTIGQAARVCGVSQNTVQEWIESGLLAVHHVGQELRITAMGLAVVYTLLRQDATDFAKPDLPEAD